MPDIILHIGFPKTATTYLQNHIFPSLGALGANSTVPGWLSWEEKIENMVCFRKPEEWKSAEWDSLADNLASFAPKEGTILYSGEYWLRGPARFFPKWQWPCLPIQESHLAIEHIEAFHKYVWKDRGRIRVWVTVRNQADWLASRYAQNSNRMFSPGQADFERQVLSLLDDSSAAGASFLDYNLLASGLENLVGPENVFFFAYDNLTSGEQWQKLEHWSGMPFPGLDPIPSAHTSSPRENQRRLAGKIWETQKTRVLTLQPWVRRLDGLTRPSLGCGLCTITARLENLLSRQKEISLTAELRKEIQTKYAASNHAFEKQTGITLPRDKYFDTLG